MSKPQTPDEIAAAVNEQRPIQLKVWLHPADPNEEFDDPRAVIEGSPEELRFLGELLIATSNQAPGFDFPLNPRGAGSAHLAHDSDLALYFEVR